MSTLVLFVWVFSLSVLIRCIQIWHTIVLQIWDKIEGAARVNTKPKKITGMIRSVLCILLEYTRFHCLLMPWWFRSFGLFVNAYNSTFMSSYLRQLCVRANSTVAKLLNRVVDPRLSRFYMLNAHMHWHHVEEIYMPRLLSLITTNIF